MSDGFVSSGELSAGLGNLAGEMKKCECDLADSMRAKVAELAGYAERLKSKEDELRASEAKYRRLHESMTDAFVRVDMTGKIVESNQVYQNMLGYTADELSFLTYSDITPASWHEMEARIVAEQIMPEGYSSVYEKEYIRHDGKIFPVELRTFLLRDEKGEPSSLWAIVRDLTERKQAEELKRQTDLKLLEAQKLESLSVMAGGIAHDFNNLLMGIMGNAELTLGELPPNSPVRENIEEIGEASKRAAELCRQLLAYTGHGWSTTQNVSLNDAVSDVVRILRKTMPPSVSIALSLAEDLPPIHGDPAQIRQMTMNLITNGIEAIGEGGGEVMISSGVRDCSKEFLHNTIHGGERTPGSYVWLKVADTGCGIDAGIQRRIFEPFFTTKFMGRGLGLSAALGIVNSHGGALKLDSRQGAGSCFFVLLPAEAAQRAKDTAPGLGLDEKIRGTILLVDDDDMVRELGKEMLEKFGLRVFTASDGVDAVEKFSKRHREIDLVLLDLTMPRMNGEQTLWEIRKIEPAIRVVMSSGYTEADVSARIHDLHMTAFLPKPYTAQQLRHCIARVMNKATADAPSSK